MKTFTASLGVAVLASSFALVATASSPAQAACADTVPLMTIKIFNRDPNTYIFPVLTMGKDPTGDVWLQSCFKVPANEIGQKNYPRTLAYRIYAFPQGGIKPCKNCRDADGITLTLPLYTQMVTSVQPSQPNQYIDWWKGGTIQLYSSTSPEPPRALKEAMEGKNEQANQTEVFPIGSAVKPTCPQCQTLKFYSDTADLPKNHPSQLVEFTLGARIAQPVKNPNTDPPNDLDLQNVDFDVSYVNVAFLPAAMGPFMNNQVGYVGTPISVSAFQTDLNNFLKSPQFKGWPQFVTTFADGTKETILKLPSTLEIFARLGPGLLAPPDLTAAPNWPTKLWTPIQILKDLWIKYAGTSNPYAAGTCKATAAKNTFCDAIIDVKTLMKANYDSYRANFASKCAGSPFTLTDELMIAHVYGWTPFNESTIKDGCAADFNLLQETPGYRTPITTPPPGRFDYSEYSRVKLAFDLLNYDRLPGAPLGYTFNPWAKLIHDDHYINAPNVYAYSVDDAVGNIQAEGLGFIIDVGGLQDLENQRPADPPININYGIAGAGGFEFTHYRISCALNPDQNRPVRAFFPSFVINANDPSKCPIFFLDNKSPPQLYTFKLTQEPPYPLFSPPQTATWDANTTAKPFDCTANAGSPPFQPSSRKWCCELLAVGGNGVFAFSQPEPFSAHKSVNHNVQVHGPEEKTTIDPTTKLCSGGQPITTTTTTTTAAPRLSPLRTR